MQDKQIKFNHDTVEAWLADPVTKAYMAWIEQDKNAHTNLLNINLGESVESIAMTTVALANRAGAAEDYTDKASIYDALTVRQEEIDE